MIYKLKHKMSDELHAKYTKMLIPAEYTEYICEQGWEECLLNHLLKILWTDEDEVKCMKNTTELRRCIKYFFEQNLSKPITQPSKSEIAALKSFMLRV